MGKLKYAVLKPDGSKREEEEEEDDFEIEDDGTIVYAEKSREIVTSVRRFVSNIVGGFSLSLKYVIAESRRNRRNTYIGMFTVFLVVCFVSLLQNAISHTPVIFMKLGENQVGEFDLVITPASNELVINNFTKSDQQSTSSKEGRFSNSKFNFLLNDTEIAQALEPLDQVLGVTPRWTLLTRVMNADDPSRNTSAILLLMDMEKEDEMGLGRNWKLRPLGEGEAYISVSALHGIGVRANRGEKVFIGLDMLKAVGALGSLDKSTVRPLLVSALTNILQNQTITVPINTSTIFQLLGLPEPPGVPDQFNVTLDGDQVPQAAIEQIADAILDRYWDAIQDRLGPSGIRLEFTVVDELHEPNGKWPTALGNVAVLNSRYLLKTISKAVPRNQVLQNQIAKMLGLQDPDDNKDFDLRGYVNSQQINDYAMEVIVNYKYRMETYIKDTRSMNIAMDHFSNLVAETLGIDYRCQYALPLQTILVGINLLKMFLDQIFHSVLITLVGLGIVLIYSLLLSDVEEKTYEYGMLRALGLPQNNLIELLLIQSVFFSVPGIIIGLTLGYLGSLPIIAYICSYAAVPVIVEFSLSAILIGTFVGFFMPIISNILPIQRALSRTLRDSLDVYHSTTSEVTVRMVKMESLGLDAWQIVSSLMMVGIGFTVYYVIPYTFIFENIPLFLTILNTILLGMLFGISVLAAVLQPFLEKIVLRFLLWGSEKNLLSLVQKSLSGHRNRNRKTALMFTTCLAFIIFAGAMFSLQAQSIVDNVRANVASDVMVLAPFYGDPLDQKGMTEFLEAEMNKPKGERVLENYSFVTFPMWLIPDVRHNWVSNLAELPWFHLQFFGTDRDFLNTIFSEYLLVTETCDQFEYDGLLTDSSKPDVIKSLYDSPRQQLLPVEKESGLLIPPSVLSGRNPSTLSTTGEVFYYRNNSETYTDFIEVFGSEALRYSMYVDTDSPMIMDLSANFIQKSSIDFRYLLKMRAMAKKAPGFLFSSYKQTAFASHMIITMDSFQELTNRIYEMRRTGLLDSGFSPEEANDKISGLPSSPNMNRLLMKLVDGFNSSQSETLQNGIRNYVTNDITVIFDTASLLSTTDVATNALIAFFDLVSVIAAVLCFFVLWLSFTSNIRENSWEFGVLRAVGLSAAQVIRVYIYEALAIIITALVLGSICGLVLAVTLTLQFNLFTEMPFSFQFPYFLFFSVLVLSLSVAIGGSYLAARHIKNREIAQVLKGGG